MNTAPFQIAGVAMAFFAGLIIGGYAFSASDSSKSDAPVNSVTTGAVDSAPVTVNRALSRGTTADSPSPQRYQQLINELRAQIETEANRREQLAAQVAAINRRLDALDGIVPTTDQLPGVAEDQLADGSAQAVNGRADRFPGSTVSTEALVEVGVPSDVADDIARRWYRNQLEGLELRDRAAREGWLESEAFNDAMRKLRENQTDLREELGDDRYDQYLYAVGRDNRIGIEFVIPGSQAEHAGLEPGDIILSYNDQRLFRARELQLATRAGERNESINLRLKRGEDTIDMTVARGPLGVTLDGIRRLPE